MEKSKNNVYSNTLNQLREGRKKRLNGDQMAIPWTRLPRLNKVLPGVIQEHYTVVSANQKVNSCPL